MSVKKEYPRDSKCEHCGKESDLRKFILPNGVIMWLCWICAHLLGSK